MSKIERALRKAEEEKRQKVQVDTLDVEPSKSVVATSGRISETDEERVGVSPVSEYFRKIAAKLRAYRESAGVGDFVFTSAVSGEGKTTNAINCSISLCQDFNLSVCLVDCDLRNPKIKDYFGNNGDADIVELLKGKTDMDSVIHPTSVRGLSVVYSHRADQPTLPLLNSQNFRKFVQEFKDRFDFLIFDAPPILPVADTVVLAKQISGVVLVIESGRTRRKHVELMFEQIDRDKVIGFIMNYKRHRMPTTHSYAKYYDYGRSEKERP